MIHWTNFVDLGSALTTALNDANIQLIRQNGEFYVSDLEAAEIIASTVDPLSFEKAAKIVECKAFAQSRIFEICPLWKQLNISFAVAQNLQSESDIALLQQITDIRNASNIIEARIHLISDWRVAESFCVETAEEWPWNN